MNRPDHNNAEFFVGTEVEHTPVHGQRTLFVIGVHSKQDILTRALNNRCAHIYLGANHSFQPKDHAQFQNWNNLLCELLEDGIWVTLDFDVAYFQQPWFSIDQWCKHNHFIPMISVKLPNIAAYNRNATVKLDDVDFDHSNPGVWCHSVHSLMEHSKFTDWHKYTSDEIIS